MLFHELSTEAWIDKDKMLWVHFYLKPRTILTASFPHISDLKYPECKTLSNFSWYPWVHYHEVIMSTILNFLCIFLQEVDDWFESSIQPEFVVILERASLERCYDQLFPAFSVVNCYKREETQHKHSRFWICGPIDRWAKFKLTTGLYQNHLIKLQIVSKALIDTLNQIGQLIDS